MQAWLRPCYLITAATIFINPTITFAGSLDHLTDLTGKTQVTVTLKKVSCGTELTIVQEGIPDAIPAEACYLGWQESLLQLEKLVEPEIPD